MARAESKESHQVSRTRKKQAAQRLQALGERLVALPEEQLGAVPMPAELAEAIAMARTMRTHGARRRQLQYIGALIRGVDPEPIEKALEELVRGDRNEVRRFKQVEAWRDALLAGDGAVLAEIQASCCEVDLNRVDQLVAEAHDAKTRAAKKRAARILFRYLKKSITT